MNSFVTVIRGELIGAKRLCESAVDKLIADGRHRQQSQVNQIRKQLEQVIEELEPGEGSGIGGTNLNGPAGMHGG